MQKYEYQAVNLNKRKFKGVYLAESEEHLRKLLSDQKLYLVSCKVIKSDTPNNFFSLSIGNSVKITEITSFCRQFSIMINAGIPIVKCLEVLKEQSYTQYFRKILNIVHEDVLSGLLLSEALKKHRKVFPEFFYSMAYVGEMSGQLDTVLTNLADYYENDIKMKKKVKSAMAYPVILFVLTIVVVMAMMIFIIPRFIESFASMKVEMPKLTMAIFGISQFFVNYWAEVFLLIGLIILLIVSYKKTPKGRYVFDTLKLNIPVLKTAHLNLLTARFARGFGLLIASGMQVVDAMEIMSDIMGNKNLEKRFKMAVEDVKRGMSLTMALNTYKLFPDILIQMVSIGEKSATLDSVLLRSCSYFDNEVEEGYTKLATILQPIMISFLGLTIAIMFLAIYSPMLSIMQAF